VRQRIWSHTGARADYANVFTLIPGNSSRWSPIPNPEGGQPMYCPEPVVERGRTTATFDAAGGKRNSRLHDDQLAAGQSHHAHMFETGSFNLREGSPAPSADSAICISPHAMGGSGDRVCTSRDGGRARGRGVTILVRSALSELMKGALQSLVGRL